MMELKVATRQCTDDAGKIRRFHYYLTVEQAEGPYMYCENYGVRIEEEGGGAETVPGITPSASRIDELMTLLVDNRVGPVGLRDVISDWL